MYLIFFQETVPTGQNIKTYMLFAVDNEQKNKCFRKNNPVVFIEIVNIFIIHHKIYFRRSSLFIYGFLKYNIVTF